MNKDVNSLCRICAHNVDCKYCEVGNDLHDEYTLRHMNDCEDFVLREQNEKEESIENNNSLNENKIMDKDLLFMRNAENADLKVLVDYLTQATLTEELSIKECYKKYYPNQLQLMCEDIADELQRFGGNTFMNILRGGGVDYKELLIDVCKKMKVNFNPESTVEVIEYNLLQKTFIDSLDNMNDEELKKMINEMNIPHQGFGKQAMIAAIQIAIKKGGFAAYKLAVIVANAVCRTLLGRSLSFAANATLTRWLSVFAGPIGWAITTIWTAIDIAGPAYRVTIPAVIQIAYMRTKINYIEDNNQSV